MIRPILQDDAFLADLQAASNEREVFHAWWLGQSGFLIHWDRHWLLLDPYLSDSLTKKYADTDKPHVRMTERVIDPSRLDMIEVVTASHHHTDHMDPETLRLLVRVNPRLQLVCPESHRTLAHERSQLPSEAIHWMDAQGRTDIGVFTFHAVPAAHEELERDVGGWHVYLGFVVSFGPWSIYHSGDTVLYPGIEDWIRPFQVDLALLPINGRGPERRVAGNLWGREAAALALQIGAKCAIPCHYEMFEFNTASPDEFTAVCQRIGQPYRVLRAGERWTSRRLSLGTGLVQ